MENKHLDFFNKNFQNTLTEKQKRVIKQYDTVTKLRAVMRWKERMSKVNLSGMQLADDVKISYTRISEYLNFKKQPKDDRFFAIESAIYNREK